MEYGINIRWHDSGKWGWKQNINPNNPMKYLNYRNPTYTTKLWDDFEDFFNKPSSFLSSVYPSLYGNAEAQSPAVDLYQDDSNYFVEVHLSGYQRKQIQVELDKNRLVLSGTRGEESKENSNVPSFQRSVTLPQEVKADKVAATYENGLLTVTVPKADAVKPRSIEIKG
jgi:HSP20 family protein